MFALVNLVVAAQIGNNREVAPTARNLTCEWLFACMAVHVCLERRWAGKPLVADLALVLLLRAGRDLGAE